MTKNSKTVSNKTPVATVKPSKRSGARARALEGLSADTFLLLDKKLTFVRMNPTAQKMFSSLGLDVVGKNIVDVVPDIKETGRYDKYLNVIRTGKPFFADGI